MELKISMLKYIHTIARTVKVAIIKDTLIGVLKIDELGLTER